MGITLVINPGSTSKKYGLYRETEALFEVRFEEVGDTYSVSIKSGKITEERSIQRNEYENTLVYMLTCAEEASIVSDTRNIKNVGIRIVAPGNYFQQHRVIDKVYMDRLEKIQRYVPLHIDPILSELSVARIHLQGAVFHAISDSAFHATIPEYRRTFSIPHQETEIGEIKRFGYHGLSVASAVRRAPTLFGNVPSRMLVCHVGGGVSITALSDGVSVDTSMGYSPASGNMMGTRAGDLAADALIAFMDQANVYDSESLFQYMYKEGGFKGVAGVADLRTVLDRWVSGDENAKNALRMFRYQIQKHIGSYQAILGGIDTLILTGTAVVRNPLLRSFLLEGLEGIGITLDTEQNDSLVGKEGSIHAKNSIAVVVLKTDEMGEIARTIVSLEKEQ